MSKKMKKTKRFASCAVAAMLGLSSLGIGSVPALAADTTVTGEGEMNYVDMSKYTQVLLPTAATMQFALDPQGLSTMGTDTVSTKDLDAEAGKIVSNGEVSIANYGYYPVKAAVKLYVTDSGASKLVSDPADIASDTTRKVYLTVTPSDAETTVTADANGFVSGTDSYNASSEAVAITQTAVATAKNMVYALSGADYNFKKTEDAETGKVTYSAERDATGKYGAASFKIGGEINKNADWAPYIAAKAPKTLKLNAVFSYSSMTAEEYDYLTEGFKQPGTYNLIADNAPQVQVDTMKYDPERGSSLQISLGSGALASTITGVKFVKHTKKTKKADDSNVPVADAPIGVKGYSTNITGTVLNIPATAAIQTELGKLDLEDPAIFDDTTNEYLKISYDDAAGTFNFEITYDLVITYADKTTSDPIPVTMIKYQAPDVQYRGTDLAKKTTAATNAAITGNITVAMGNSATEITKVALNEAKTTATGVTVSAVDDTKVTYDETSITIGASAFKYQNTAAGSIVYTVTFDSGETVDLVIPVAG